MFSCIMISLLENAMNTIIFKSEKLYQLFIRFDETKFRFISLNISYHCPHKTPIRVNVLLFEYMCNTHCVFIQLWLPIHVE